jgi:uncharacterized protein
MPRWTEIPHQGMAALFIRGKGTVMTARRSIFRFGRMVLAASLALAAFASLSTASAQQLSVFDPNVGTVAHLRVQSFQERRFASTIRQRYDYSCGSAALATILTHHYGRPVTEVAVFRDMFERGDQARIQQAGFSLYDMQQFLLRQGLQSNGFRVTLDQMLNAGVPAIALINADGYLHFVVVRGIRDGRVLLADPNRGTIARERALFESQWNGVAFVITDQMEEARATFNRDQDWAALPRAPVATVRDMLQSTVLGWRDRSFF